MVIKQPINRLATKMSLVAGRNINILTSNMLKENFDVDFTSLDATRCQRCKQFGRRI